jgi:RHS repeat-associated protein
MVYGTGPAWSLGWSYDPATGRLLSDRAGVGAAASRERDYEYDSLGQLKNLFTYTAAGRKDEHYSYDTLGRMIAKDSNSYSYDAIGNVTSKPGAGGYGYGEWTPDLQDSRIQRLVQPHAVKSIGTATFAYDAVGNMTQGGGRTYRYDALHRLTRVALKNGSILEYGYDAVGSLVEKRNFFLPLPTTPTKKTKKDSPSKVVRMPTRDFHEIKSGTDTTLRRMAWMGSECVSEIVGKKGQKPQIHWFLRNPLGSATEKITAKGKLTELAAYEPFGGMSDRAGNDMGRGYTGHVEDLDGGLLWMGARWYDPQIGRFLVPDRVWSDVRRPQSLNPYSYVLNNPVNSVDPSGLAPIPIPVFGIAGFTFDPEDLSFGVYVGIGPVSVGIGYSILYDGPVFTVGGSIGPFTAYAKAGYASGTDGLFEDGPEGWYVGGGIGVDFGGWTIGVSGWASNFNGSGWKLQGGSLWVGPQVKSGFTRGVGVSTSFNPLGGYWTLSPSVHVGYKWGSGHGIQLGSSYELTNGTLNAWLGYTYSFGVGPVLGEFTTRLGFSTNLDESRPSIRPFLSEGFSVTPEDSPFGPSTLGTITGRLLSSSTTSGAGIEVEFLAWKMNSSPNGLQVDSPLPGEEREAIGGQ